VAVIKKVLREELENSLRLQESYEQELARLPKGTLVEKQIKGRGYFYLVERRLGKVCFTYRGKLPPEEIARYKDIKESRARYRKLLSRTKKQVKYLRSVLRGKQDV